MSSYFHSKMNDLVFRNVIIYKHYSVFDILKQKYGKSIWVIQGSFNPKSFLIYNKDY